MTPDRAFVRLAFVVEGSNGMGCLVSHRHAGSEAHAASPSRSARLASCVLRPVQASSGLVQL